MMNLKKEICFFKRMIKLIFIMETIHLVMYEINCLKKLKDKMQRNKKYMCDENDA